MKNEYIDAGGVAVCLNYKSASASICRSVIKAYHPAIEQILNTPPGEGKGVAYPKGMGPDSTRWHFQTPKITPDAGAEVVLVSRDKIERFRSACSECDVADVDALLDKLESGDVSNVHFWPESRFYDSDTPPTKVFRFEDQLEDAAKFLGLEWPLPDIKKPGGAKVQKPNLTTSQINRVIAYYGS